jgi:hypothetical protein
MVILLGKKKPIFPIIPAPGTINAIICTMITSGKLGFLAFPHVCRNC